jgi:hypothetical protein
VVFRYFEIMTFGVAGWSDPWAPGGLDPPGAGDFLCREGKMRISNVVEYEAETGDEIYQCVEQVIRVAVLEGRDAVLIHNGHRYPISPKRLAKLVVWEEARRLMGEGLEEESAIAAGIAGRRENELR